MRSPLYTRGPWFADGVFIETEGGIKGQHIATVATTSAESQANAVLIAAAPDLIAALKELLASQQAVSASRLDAAAHRRRNRAEAAALALLARIDVIAPGKPESEPLSGVH